LSNRTAQIYKYFDFRFLDWQPKPERKKPTISNKTFVERSCTVFIYYATSRFPNRNRIYKLWNL